MTRTISVQVSPKTRHLAAFRQFHRPSYIFEKIPHLALRAPMSITKWMGEALLRLYDIPKPDKISDYEEFKIYLNQWVENIDERLCEFSDEVPKWFDPEKFARGRAFAMRHILGLIYAEELSVILLMSLPMLRKPLIFTGKSDTTDKAFRRYLSTVERVMTWYAQDIWVKNSRAYHNLMVVRGMHNRVDNDMKYCITARRESKIKQFESTTTPFLRLLRSDLRPYLPNGQQQKWLDILQTKNGPYINQLGMALTQIGFVALLILAPGKFGASRASQEDLEDFVYVWYVLGRQLGIADRFNICAGGLKKTRKRCQLILRHLVLPSLAIAGRDWEHMSRCVVAGAHRILRQTSFEASFAYSLWALNVPTPRINTLITWHQLPRVWLFKWVLCVILNIPGFPDIFRILLSIRLTRVRRRLDAADMKKRQ